MKKIFLIIVIIITISCKAQRGSFYETINLDPQDRSEEYALTLLDDFINNKVSSKLIDCSYLSKLCLFFVKLIFNKLVKAFQIILWFFIFTIALLAYQQLVMMIRQYRLIN